MHYQKVGDEIVFLNLNSGVYFGLDPVGTRIWELLVQQKNTTEILEEMLEEFEVDRSTLQNDLEELLTELRGKGLIALRSGG